MKTRRYWKHHPRFGMIHVDLPFDRDCAHVPEEHRELLNLCLTIKSRNLRAMGWFMTEQQAQEFYAQNHLQIYTAR